MNQQDHDQLVKELTRVIQGHNEDAWAVVQDAIDTVNNYRDVLQGIYANGCNGEALTCAFDAAEALGIEYDP